MSDQYFAPTAGTAGAPVYELSGWWRRVGALIIDGIIISIPIIVVGIFVAIFAASDLEDSGDLGVGGSIFILILLLGGLVLPTFYYCWIMPKTNGQTIGKKALEIRVVREDGQPITVGFAFTREILVITLGFNLIGGMLLFNLPILIDYLWPLWDSNNQALHDKIVKSRVVRAQASVAMQPPSQPWPVGSPTAPPAPVAPTVPYVPPEQRYVAPQPPAEPQFPQQAVAPPPPAPPGPVAPPAPPAPGGTSTPYTPPPGFENPVPDDE